MAKKRNMPHGRSVARAKKPIGRTPATVSRESEEANVGAPTLTSPIPRTTVGASSSVLRSSSTRPSRGTTGLTTDYRYVVADLKRIGVLAAATFAILFGLTFVIK